jgi:hypothetical protein
LSIFLICFSRGFFSVDELVLRFGFRETGGAGCSGNLTLLVFRFSKSLTWVVCRLILVMDFIAMGNFEGSLVVLGDMQLFEKIRFPITVTEPARGE